MEWLKKLFGKGEDESAPASSEEEEPIAPDPDQVRRKDWAEAILTEQGIPTNQYLPMIESERETIIRSAQEIAGRLLALAAVAGAASDDNRKAVEAYVDEKGARAYFTLNEAEFFGNPKPEKHTQIQFSWQYECTWVLMWALHLVDEPLGFPDATCDVDQIIEVVCTNDDLTTKGVRSKSDILDQADLIYRYHWAVRQAGLDGEAEPGGLHGGVVMERHRALNWLVGYNGEDDWDEMTTDT